MPEPTSDTPENAADARPMHFIEQAIADDLDAGRYDRVITRFPPEPNGYLHIGHAKAICIDFGMARRFADRVSAATNLRMDDTNPSKEEQEYIDSIVADVEWLGFKPDRLTYASDCFDQLYAWARLLIEHGDAYVDDQPPDEIKRNRGDLKTPGTPSPFRDRPAEESLDLFERMKRGEFPDGSRVLRAKIDMAAPNMVLRDPTMYRILRKAHPRTGDTWCIYPMYDWAHGQCDWIEGVTHSLCDLSFEIHRPLYEWFIDRLAELGAYPAGVSWKSRQIEFARGNITYMITSKRKLKRLVDEGHVRGWDDPRMPTLRGMRRRGYTPAAIRRFWDEVGVAKRENNIEFAKLENILRDDLNKVALRRMAVLDPLKVVITNYDDDRTEMMDAPNNPEDDAAGTRQVPFSKVIYIEREDFMEDPPRKFFRLGPGREVRLRCAYWITCREAIKDEAGHITELRCTYDPQTRGGNNPPPDSEGKVRKVKGTLHWVSDAHALDAEVRLYEHLFTKEDPEDGELLDNVNPQSLKVVRHAKLEPALANAKPGEPIQFERLGYFTADADGAAERPVFNRTIGLRDSWAKIARKG
jgi:glutaminyl-tRNA synthetase